MAIFETLTSEFKYTYGKVQSRYISIDPDEIFKDLNIGDLVICIEYEDYIRVFHEHIDLCKDLIKMIDSYKKDGTRIKEIIQSDLDDKNKIKEIKRIIKVNSIL